MRNKTSQELAKALGVSSSTIRYQARRGRLPHDVTPGGHRRFDVDEVRAALTAPSARSAVSLSLEPVDFGAPLTPSVEYDHAQLNESAHLMLTATAGGDEQTDEAWPLPTDPFEVFAVHGEARYPQQAHGVGAGA
jgi:excisionase family DNA binding protein